MSLLLVGNGWWSVLFVVLVVTLFGQALLYRSRFTLSILDDLPRLGMRYLAAAALTFLAAFLFGVPWRDVTPVLLLVLFVLLVVERSLVYVLIRRLRRQRVFGKNTLIVGTRDLSRRLAGQMVADRSLGLRPIGYVDRPPSEVRDELNLPVLGPVSDLAEVIERYRPDIVIVGYAFESLPDQVEFMRDADRLSSTMLVVPRLYEVTPVRSTDEVISDVPMTRLRRGPFRSPMWKLKRVVDMLVSGIAILLLSPLLAILALVDRIVDGPGVIFRQERVGLDGRTIEVMKFRSLRPASEEESATNWNIKHDDRVSWYGKFLRRSSLDELPQLFNIWRGDMSLVGPRPERPHFVREFAQLYPFYGSRHRVPCGLTGWAQVNACAATPRSGARPLRQLLYRELVGLAGHQDHAAHHHHPDEGLWLRPRRRRPLRPPSPAPGRPGRPLPQLDLGAEVLAVEEDVAEQLPAPRAVAHPAQQPVEQQRVGLAKLARDAAGLP